MPLCVLPGVVHNEDDFAVDSEVVRALWRLEDGHFWYAARNRWIAEALRHYGVIPPAKLLEVGCGSGGVARHLHALGYDVTGIDTAEALVEKAHERCADASFIVGDVRALPEDLRGTFRGIGFFDVLEHLSEPGDLLRGSLSAAAPGALVVATVPALRSLHSAIDELSGHKRRYEPGELSALFERCGLACVSEHGLFRASLPLLRHARRRAADVVLSELSAAERREMMIEHLRVPPAPVNAAMGALCALERLAFRASRAKAGASLLAVGWVERS